MAEPIGAKLRDLRKRKKWSQEEVTRRLQILFPNEDTISTSTLNKWERGLTRRMYAGDLANLVVLYGADFEEVFSLLVTRVDGARAARELAKSPPPEESADHSRTGRRSTRGKQ